MFTRDTRAVAETAEGFRLMFPSFADVPIEDAWGGPIDVSPTHLPTFGRAGTSNVYYAAGYTGNGVAPTRIAGEVLADLITGVDTATYHVPALSPGTYYFKCDIHSTMTGTVEVSGGLIPGQLRAYAESGADFLSIGRLTHSAPAVDLSLEVEPLV